MPGGFFDPKGELLIYWHCRPHWSQAGAVVFNARASPLPARHRPRGATVR